MQLWPVGIATVIWSPGLSPGGQVTITFDGWGCDETTHDRGLRNDRLHRNALRGLHRNAHRLPWRRRRRRQIAAGPDPSPPLIPRNGADDENGNYQSRDDAARRTRTIHELPS